LSLRLRASARENGKKIFEKSLTLRRKGAKDAEKEGGKGGKGD